MFENFDRLNLFTYFFQGRCLMPAQFESVRHRFDGAAPVGAASAGVASIGFTDLVDVLGGLDLVARNANGGVVWTGGDLLRNLRRQARRISSFLISAEKFLDDLFSWSTFG
jgi:hypothetical protein